jgi:hypothetical protein
MPNLVLTDAQANVVEGTDAAARDSLLKDIRAQAQKQANAAGEPVEITTPKGGMIDVVVPNG